MNLIGGFDIVDSVTDALVSTELNGANAIATTVIDGTTYVYVSANVDDGIQILKLNADGTLETVGAFENDPTVFLNGPRDMEVVGVGNNKFLIVSSADWAVNSLRIVQSGAREGELESADIVNYNEDEITALQGANGIDTFETPNGTFVAVAAERSSSVTILKVATDGTMTEIDVVQDAENGDFRLATAQDVSIHSIGNKTFLYAASSTEGISVFEINNNGTMRFVDGFSDFFRVQSLKAGNFNGQDYLIVPDEGASTITLFSLAANGTATFLSTVNVNTEFNIRNPYQLDIITIDGVDYIITHGYNGTVSNTGSVAILSINANDEVDLVQILQAPELDGVIDVEHVQIGSRHFLLAAAFDDDRIVSLEIGNTTDGLLGTVENDKIVGLAGDDDLIGRQGNDLLKGGAGNDFLTGNAGSDTLDGGRNDDVLAGGAGDDMLRGASGADVIVGGRGDDSVSYTGSSSAVTVDLAAETVDGGHATGDRITGIESAIGSDFGDVLRGDAGANTLIGGRGGDRLEGRAGDDRIEGGNGVDRGFGGDGKDRLLLGRGDDIGNGGKGRDTVFGGAGKDELLGGDGADRLLGQAGNDTLNGGAGNDTMIGGSGADVFVFGNVVGTDVIEDFTVNTDKIDLSRVDGFDSFADVSGSLIPISGSTLIFIDGQNSIQLSDVSTNQLDADDFLF